MQYTSYSITKLIVNYSTGNVQIDLNTSTIIDGVETSIISSNLNLNKLDNISSQPEIVQKACNDAWAEVKAEA